MTSPISDVHRELIENIMRYFVTATAVIFFRGEDFCAFHRVIFLLCEACQIHLLSSDITITLRTLSSLNTDSLSTQNAK